MCVPLGYKGKREVSTLARSTLNVSKFRRALRPTQTGKLVRRAIIFIFLEARRPNCSLYFCHSIFVTSALYMLLYLLFVSFSRSGPRVMNASSKDCFKLRESPTMNFSRRSSAGKLARAHCQFFFQSCVFKNSMVNKN